MKSAVFRETARRNLVQCEYLPYKANPLSEPLAISQHFERAPTRSRSASAFMAIALIVFGLASRKFSAWMPELLQKNLGDILWAGMVFFALGFLFPQLSTRRLATLAFVFSFCIEVSKLFHASWFDAIRATEIGRLIFGYVFGWSNLLRYFIGIVFAAGWDYWNGNRFRSEKRK